jgi:multidrug efflux pump subunit AcrA (membrane-fusion protein)
MYGFMKFMNSSNRKSYFAYRRSAIVAIALLTVWAPPARAGEVRISVCIVSLIDDVTLAAKEDGLVHEIAVREGSIVKPGQVLARLDDRQAVVQRQIADAQYEVAAKKADGDVDARLARAEAKVKKFEQEHAAKANQVVRDVVGEVELTRMALAFEEATLKAEKADHDQAVLVREKQVRALEIEAARLGVERRTITSPIDGLVVQKLSDIGEWAKAGDPICRVIRLDKLWVEGLVEAKSHGPAEVFDKEVEIRVEAEAGRVERFSGRVVFVDPQIDGNGRFRMRAEVQNRKQDNFWLLMPGQTADMTIAPATGRKAP